MSFIEATHEARDKGADYVCYRNLATFVVVATHSAVNASVANTDLEGFRLIAAGISASRKSLYNFDTGLFECGTVAQLAPNGEA